MRLTRRNVRRSGVVPRQQAINPRRLAAVRVSVISLAGDDRHWAGHMLGLNTWCGGGTAARLDFDSLAGIVTRLSGTFMEDIFFSTTPRKWGGCFVGARLETSPWIDGAMSLVREIAR